MASTSKTINMPLIFAISIGAAVSLTAITMFGLAWYEDEQRDVLEKQVLERPTYDDEYLRIKAEQEASLEGIEQTAAIYVAKQAKPADGDDPHGGHGGDGGHGAESP